MKIFEASRREYLKKQQRYMTCFGIFCSFDPVVGLSLKLQEHDWCFLLAETHKPVSNRTDWGCV